MRKRFEREEYIDRTLKKFEREEVGVGTYLGRYLGKLNMSGIGVRAVALCKRGWNEIPEVVGSGLMAVVGASLGIYYALKFERDEMYQAQHRYFYTVYRHDDPKAAKVRPCRRDDLKYGL